MPRGWPSRAFPVPLAVTQVFCACGTSRSSDDTPGRPRHFALSRRRLVFGYGSLTSKSAVGFEPTGSISCEAYTNQGPPLKHRSSGPHLFLPTPRANTSPSDQALAPDFTGLLQLAPVFGTGDRDKTILVRQVQRVPASTGQIRAAQKALQRLGYG